MQIPSNTWKNFRELSDQEVWDQLRGGNHLALEYLYRTYGKELFNFGMKLYGKHEWVQDTLHELYVDLWKQRQKLTAVNVVKTYLFKAFKYKLQRQYSQEKRWLYRVDFERLPGMEVELPLESQMISIQLSRERLSKVAQAIEKAPTRQSEIIYLLFFKKLPQKETANLMSINLASVYTLTSKAIKNLKKQLA